MKFSTFFLIALAAVASTSLVPAGPLYLGTASVEITPPIGWRMAGNFYEKFSTGIHDPLYAKAMVWKQGDKRAALLMLDVCSVGREVSDPARRLASQRTGIPVENIIIAATHTHAGPEFYGVLRDLFHNAAIQKQGRDPHEPIDFQKLLAEKSSDAIERANLNLQEVSLSSGAGRQEGIVFNRRYLMKDGTVQFNPARMDPDIVRAAGPVDRDLSVFLFRGNDEEPVASLTSFPMHVATFGGTEYGADFPAIMQELLKQEFGAEFFSLFGMGTSGDTNHLQFLTGKPKTPTREIGEALTQTFLRTVPSLTGQEGELDMRTVRVGLPLKEVTQEQIAWAEKVLNREWVAEPAFLVLVEAWRILGNQRLRERDGSQLKAEVQVIRLSGETAVVALPHEIFVELGLEIKRRSPFRDTLIITLANDMDFYVPTGKAFAEGSYEIVTSPLISGGGETLVDAAVGLLKDLSVQRAGAQLGSH